MNKAEKWPIFKTEYFEVVLPAGTTVNRVNLPDIQNLRDTHILGLEMMYDFNYKVGINGGSVILAANFKEMFLTLQLYNGKEFVHQRPAVLFGTITNDNGIGNTFENEHTRDFVGQRVNYPKSYIDFATAFTPAVQTVIPFIIYYRDKKAIEKQDMQYEFSNKG